MKQLSLNVLEPGEIIATVSKSGKVAVFTVSVLGELVPSDNHLLDPMPDLGGPIENLDLTVRAFNVLKREGIDTIGQLFDFYDLRGIDGFDDMRNMGVKCRDEIVGHIHRLRGET